MAPNPQHNFDNIIILTKPCKQPIYQKIQVRNLFFTLLIKFDKTISDHKLRVLLQVKNIELKVEQKKPGIQFGSKTDPQGHNWSKTSPFLGCPIQAHIAKPISKRLNFYGKHRFKNSI